MTTKKFGVAFFSAGGALTVEPEFIGVNESGWTITGVIHEDFCLWVNEFDAWHPVFGRVWGDFEKSVFADRESGFDHFWKHHQPFAWDYQDI